MKSKIKALTILFARKINRWRFAHMSEKQFMLLLSIPTGFLAGLSAIIIKKLAHFIRDYFYNIATIDGHHYGLLFFILPAIGILFTIIFCRIILNNLWIRSVLNLNNTVFNSILDGFSIVRRVHVHIS